MRGPNKASLGFLLVSGFSWGQGSWPYLRTSLAVLSVVWDCHCGSSEKGHRCWWTSGAHRTAALSPTSSNESYPPPLSLVPRVKNCGSADLNGGPFDLSDLSWPEVITSANTGYIGKCVKSNIVIFNSVLPCPSHWQFLPGSVSSASVHLSGPVLSSNSLSHQT